MLTLQVVVHQASTEHMDFVTKNFRYVTQPFGEFIQAVDAGDRLYLRSLSAEKPSEQPADLDRDFPAIAKDFRLPPELRVVTENSHSSALRISGPVNMWLHYDVGISVAAPT
jgi:tRNA wybutosine-synthesizing protein 4